MLLQRLLCHREKGNTVTGGACTCAVDLRKTPVWSVSSGDLSSGESVEEVFVVSYAFQERQQ